MLSFKTSTNLRQVSQTNSEEMGIIGMNELDVTQNLLIFGTNSIEERINYERWIQQQISYIRFDNSNKAPANRKSYDHIVGLPLNHRFDPKSHL